MWWARLGQLLDKLLKSATAAHGTSSPPSAAAAMMAGFFLTARLTASAKNRSSPFWSNLPNSYPASSWLFGMVHRFIAPTLSRSICRAKKVAASPCSICRPTRPNATPLNGYGLGSKKSFFANLGAKTLDQLKAAWQRALEVARSRPELIRSFFAASAIKDVVKLL